MGITRQNPYLEEIVQILDLHFERWGGNPDEARARLSASDNNWIDEEVYHCITEPRYFISNYYAIRTEDKGFQGLYPLFDSQEILHDEYRRLEREYGKVRALVLKSRQMGSTTYNCAEFFHKTIFAEHQTSLIVGQDEDQSQFIMSMYESALDFIPWWMRPRIRIKQQGKVINFDEKDDLLRMTRPGLKTWIYADNGRKPTGVGRGKTFGRAMLSELAFWTDASQLSKSLFPTFNTADGFYIMESTAKGRNNAWHNLWRRAEAGKVDWHPIFIPFYRRAKTYSLPIPSGQAFVLTEDEKEMRIRIENKDQFVISDETFHWMRNKKEEFVAIDGDDMMFYQEYTSEPEESFQSGAITAFPRGTINRMSKRTYNPKWVGEISYDIDKGRPELHVRPVDEAAELLYPENEDRLHIWERPIRGQRYAIGCDVSLGNDGGDYSCIQVLKLSQGAHDPDKQVACWHGYIDPETLAHPLIALGWLYEEALIAVEVNSMGMVTNNELVRQLEYENIYRYKRLDRLKHAVTDIIGFWTDYKSKRALMAKMSKVLIEDCIEIPCKHTIDELNDFTEDGAEGEGAHDDFVMALMIALYCGHEGETNERQNAKAKKPAADANNFRVVNRDGVVMAETNSQNEAERTAKKIIGSTIQRTSGARATLLVGDKVVKVPADHQNTEYSIFEQEGKARQLREDGVPEEQITPEMIREMEAAEEATQDDPEAWLYE